MRSALSDFTGNWTLTASCKTESGNDCFNGFGELAEMLDWLKSSDLSAIVDAHTDTGLCLTISDAVMSESLTGKPHGSFINNDGQIKAGGEIEPFNGRISHEDGHYWLVPNDVDSESTGDDHLLGFYTRFSSRFVMATDFIERTNDNTLVRTMNFICVGAEWTYRERNILIYSRVTD